MKLSIVIPVWNEAPSLAAALAAVRARFPAGVEVIVVDGGSDDRSAAIARDAGADLVLPSARGRGVQMRAGAAAAGGDVLLFLHADARLPERVGDAIDRTLRDGFDGGVFRVRHVASPRAGRWTRACVRLADLRARGMRLPYGDQGMFLSRDAYQRVGGMPAQPLMEDVELALRLRRGGFRIRRLPQSVDVSARRFEARPLRTVVCWGLFPSLYALGVAPERLHRWYGAVGGGAPDRAPNASG